MGGLFGQSTYTPSRGERRFLPWTAWSSSSRNLEQIWLALDCLCRLVRRLDGGVVYRELVVGAQLTKGGTSGTADAGEELISSLPLGRAGGHMDYEGGGETDKGMGDSCDTGAANIACVAADQDADEKGVGVSNTDQSCWTRRAGLS
ncbi:hypothetical protein VPH35_091393 [Triticum aestivum]